jgi:hypothetical protein
LACGPSCSDAGATSTAVISGVGHRCRELEAVKALMPALAAVAHLRIDDRDDPIRPRATMQPRDTVIVDVEVLADQLAQQPVRRRDRLVVEQPVSVPDRPQRPLGVLGDAREHPLALGLLPPTAIRLLRRTRIVKRQRAIELARGPLIDALDGIQELADAVTDKPHRVLGGGRAQHRRRVDDLLDRPVEHPELLRDPQRALQRHPLELVQQQPSPELHQRRWMPAAVIDRQPERDLPAQIPRDALHRLLVRRARPVLQKQHPGQQRRRDRWPPHPLRIARREVLIAHDPLPMLGQQPKERSLRQRPSKLGRIKEPHLTRRPRQHAQQGLKPAGQHATISVVS